MGDPKHITVHYWDTNTDLYTHSGRIAFGSAVPSKATTEHPKYIVNKMVAGKWAEDATQEQIDEHTQKAVKEKYTLVHEPNGFNYYQDFKAFLINDFYKGTITEAEAIQIELYLENPMMKIKNNGDWKTAQYLLSQMTGVPALIQPYYNKAVTEVSDYITNNYED